jgi:hypothetical protein
MREINNILMQYIEVPRPHSDPRKILIPSPDMRPEALLNENLTDAERQQLHQYQLYFKETGQRIPSQYQYDLKEVGVRKQQLQEFLFYRKKFEKSQRAKAEISGTSVAQKGKKLNLNLDEDMFDP